LFVQADLDEIGASQLQWIPGAVGLVHFGGGPALVPDAFIQELRQRIVQIERVGGLHLDGIKRGDHVEVVDGPFAGYEAIFDVYLKSEERVQVLMHWLGRDMKMKINANAVEKRRPR
jgi:transcriptional antiterminator RfaH